MIFRKGRKGPFDPTAESESAKAVALAFLVIVGPVLLVILLGLR